MAVVSLWRLRRPSLWADELATDGAATLSWRELADLVHHVDLVLAPYYVLMHLWTGVFGTGPGALRIPSVIAMVIAAALTADIARRLWDRRTAFVCAVLFALVPTVSRYAQEARPYAASVAAVVAAAWFVLRSDPDSPRVRDDLLSTGCLCLAGLLQPITLMSAPALLLLRGSVPLHVRRWALLAVLACVPGAVLLLLGIAYQSSVWGWITVVPWTSTPYRAGTVLGPPEAAGALLVLAAAGIRARRAELAVTAWALFPIVVLLAVGMLKPVFVGRLLEFATPAVALLGAHALTRLGRPGSVGALVVVAVLGAPYQWTIRGPAGHSQDSAAIRTIIGPRFQPGDVAVYGDLPHSIPWAARDIVRYYLPPSRTPTDILAIHPQRHDGHFLATLCTDLPTCLGQPKRVWVVRVDMPTDPLTGLPDGQTAYLRTHYRTAHTYREARLTVALLLRRSPGPVP